MNVQFVPYRFSSSLALNIIALQGEGEQFKNTILLIFIQWDRSNVIGGFLRPLLGKGLLKV